MPFSKEQLKEYWQANKEILNQKRRERRRLAKLGFAISNQVSHGEVSHNQVSQVELLKVSHKVEPKTANLAMANPKLTQLIQAWKSGTNYSCSSTCFHSYCNNCWYFKDKELVNYKGL